MKIKLGDVIKHTEMKDLAILVIGARVLGEGLIIKGYYLNQGFEKSYLVDGKLISVIIHDKNLENWLRCKKPDATCVRREEWEYLQ